MSLKIKLEECSICRHKFRSMKIFQCGHKLCLQCTIAIAVNTREGRKSVQCPLCRKRTVFDSVNKLPTYFFGQMKCSICLKRKDVGDTWWCPNCIQLICSTCYIQQHSSRTGHKLYKWDSLQAVQDIGHTSRLRNEKNAVQMSNAKASPPSGPEKVQKFLKEIEEYILKRLNQPIVPFHESLEELFGHPHIQKPNSLDLIQNPERVNAVAEEMLKLAVGDDPQALTHFASPNPFEIFRWDIDCFREKAETFGEMILQSAKFKREVEKLTICQICAPKLTSPVVAAPEYQTVPGDLNKLVREEKDICCQKSVEWNDTLLDSLRSSYQLPSGLEKCCTWTYKGQGRNFQKFLDIYDRHKAAGGIILKAEAEWMAVNLRVEQKLYGKLVKVYVYTPQCLSEESEGNLFALVCQLFSLGAAKILFILNACGHQVRKLETLWDHLPRDRIGIGAWNVDMTENGRRSLVRALRQYMFPCVWIAYDENSWKSLLTLLDQLVDLKLTKLELTDNVCGEGAEVFREFLWRISRGKSDLPLMRLRNFVFSTAHVEVLLAALPRMKQVKKVTFCNIKVEKCHWDSLQKECDKNSIALGLEDDV